MKGFVQLDELSLVDFRNFSRARILPSKRFNIISGRNGSGKTNLLEAVYILGSLRSFRTSKKTQTIREGCEKAIISGLFGDVAVRMKCDIFLGSNERSIRIDDKKTVVGSDYFSTLPMVLFHPGNMELIKGGPENRRRFLDRALFQAEPGYAEFQRSYNRALVSRNRLLKETRRDQRAIAPFDRQLASFGSSISRMRDSFVVSISKSFEDAVCAIGRGSRANVSYLPGGAFNEEEMLKQIDASFAKDCARGYTTVGPHSDDLEFLLDGRVAKAYASQGQQRTLALAAKIAETKTLEIATGRTPLMLLDDVSSELDRDRNRQLFEFLSEVGGQVFITTTHPEHILIDNDRADFFIEEGIISH